MYKHFEDIKDQVENEGLDYFLLNYASPSSISNKADEKCLKFKKLWIKILPDLQRLDDLINERGQDFEPDD